MRRTLTGDGRSGRPRLLAVLSAMGLAAGALIMSAGPASAASIVVDSTGDTIAEDGACTLREALVNANQDDQSGSLDCAAGSSSDVITFEVTGTIRLSAELTNSGIVTIQGPGARALTISGENSVRVFSNSSRLILYDLTIANGMAPYGAGIFNDTRNNASPDVTVTSSALINNSASVAGGAIGGRIDPSFPARGDVWIQGTTVQGNTAPIGAAVSTEQVFMGFSTVSGNAASTPTGSIIDASLIQVHSTTIAANDALNTFASQTRSNFTAYASLLGPNTGSSCGVGLPVSLDQGFNISSDDSCDLTATTSLESTNPMLGTLGDNGGSTQTMVPRPGSPAIDAIDPLVCNGSVDQRGVTRPQGPACDIGAVEAEVAGYDFTGFYAPVDNLPTLNAVKAGQAVPVKFSLGGDQGLDVFADGFPKSSVIPCDSTEGIDGIEETVTAGSSSLSYDSASDTYTYVWKTNKGWAKSCRQLVVTFDDGTTQRANFKFRK